MFESLALEDPRKVTRRWTTAVSFTLESAAIGLLVLAPLWYTQAISLRVGEPLVAPAGSSVTQVETRMRPQQQARQSERPIVVQNTGLEYRRFTRPRDLSPDPAPLVPGNDANAIIGAPPGNGTRNSAMDDLLAFHRSGPSGPTNNTTRTKPFPVSTLDPGMLIRKVQPIYPRPAVAARIEGTVILTALIDREGRITHLQAMSGHPFLIAAAIDAVKQWRYKPYILNGSPTEVETQVSVVFTLQH
ncbi:MAG TPA: TonB family protein [Terriglobales bacterium]